MEPRHGARRDLHASRLDSRSRGQIVVDGKFYTILAFLFGLGFSIQLGRSVNDRDAVRVYSRRLSALALIGLFNVIGTYAAGSLGQRLPKKVILSSIYALRSLAIVIFLAVPLTPWSVYVFSAVMGVLWLSTVPPTNAVIAQIFGVQYLSMLGGFVFFSHQIGSFLGVWLGGLLYDRTGSYDVVWWLAIALGLFAAAVNLPVKERAILRPGAAAA